MLEPLPSAQLAEELRRHDVFVTGSRADPCSNSLLEALHSGLPALALHDGGHPELIGKGGETFREFPEALDKLDAIASAYERYRSAIRVPSIAEVADRYIAFMAEVHAARSSGERPDGRRLRGTRAMAMALRHPASKRLLAVGLSVSRARRS